MPQSRLNENATSIEHGKQADTCKSTSFHDASYLIYSLTCFGVPRGFAVDAPPTADLGTSLDPAGLPLLTAAVGVCGFCTTDLL